MRINVEKSVVSRTSINPRYKVQTFTPSFIWQISISITSQILFRMTPGHERVTVANFPSQCKQQQNEQQQKDEMFLDIVPQIEEIIERNSFINLTFCLEVALDHGTRAMPPHKACEYC